LVILIFIIAIIIIDIIILIKDYIATTLSTMSSIYHTEPPTSGKVLIKTSFGDIDIELWAKEAPLACR
jgi:hypothetical protein